MLKREMKRLRLIWPNNLVFSRMTQLEEELKAKVLLTKLLNSWLNIISSILLFEATKSVFFLYLSLVENGFEWFLI